MPVKPEHIKKISGRDYPLWIGILDAAHREGLMELTVIVTQFPSEENQWTAAAQATAVFKDGRRFQDVGDCNPKNTTAMIAEAAIRMASTRAMGRTLRTALNIGETMYE